MVALASLKPQFNQNSTLSYIYNTTQMLRMLDKLLPAYDCWTSEWLHNNVARQGSRMLGKHIKLTHKGKPATERQHLWELSIDKAFAPKLTERIICHTQTVLGVDAEAPKRLTYTNENGTIPWNSLNFRSPAELEIAKTLEAKGILFFANSKCRIVNRLGINETKETDFLVFYKGKARILEVDGYQYHEHRRKEDYRRDRMFDQQGLSTSRFSATECLNNPEEVVEEFLELF